MSSVPERRISFSLSSILVVLATILSIVVLWQIRSLIVLLLISIVLASAIAPIVDWAERFRVPRWLTVILVYLSLIAGLVGLAVAFGPAAFTQIEQLIRSLPEYVRELTVLVENWVLSINDSRPELVSQVEKLFDIQSITAWAIRSSQQAIARSYSLTTGFVGSIINVILSLFVSGYMVADSKNLIRGAVRVLPRPWDRRLETQIGPVSARIGSYIRGRIIVSTILGVAATIGMSVLGLSDVALGLGAIAGVANFIPFVGPILGAIPSLVVALSYGWWTLLWVFLLFVIIQNLEAYILAPVVIGSSVGLHPLYLLLAVLGGTEVLGIFGALLAPPLVGGAALLLENLYLEPKEMAESQEPLLVGKPSEGMPVGQIDR
ncbi:AI-2E family transporter [Microcoleus sp. FACHB-1515]|uniref:AI-2E family transporter n=1 Tax=Cyanophyceae TaxID=3028117 RepID=UPI0016832E80|nr:AI-2E family transporter [Microcoleus sp. FACHB-1515]MBD2091975.1 AI-2E family transporter [Microcoleus sp. FACHB-1515]